MILDVAILRHLGLASLVLDTDILLLILLRHAAAALTLLLRILIEVARGRASRVPAGFNSIVLIAQNTTPCRHRHAAVVVGCGVYRPGPNGVLAGRHHVRKGPEAALSNYRLLGPLD